MECRSPRPAPASRPADGDDQQSAHALAACRQPRQREQAANPDQPDRRRSHLRVGADLRADHPAHRVHLGRADGIRQGQRVPSGGGIGYWRIVSRYTDDNTFDQELYIDQIPDPLSVYMDPNIKKQDGSDARFAFIYDDMPRDEAQKKYPNIVKRQNHGDDALEWSRRDTVRVAEYYERSESKDWLYAIPRDDGGVMLVRESSMPDEARDMLKQALDNGSNVQRRRIPRFSVDWYLIVGDEIAEKSEWLGKYIPIIRVPGEEVIIEGAPRSQGDGALSEGRTAGLQLQRIGRA